MIFMQTKYELITRSCILQPKKYMI